MFGFNRLGLIVLVAVCASVLFLPALLFIGWLVAKLTVKGTNELDRRTFPRAETDAETASDRD